MLNKEQTEYIDSLRVTNPGIPDATLREMFVGAKWPEEEIGEALTRYKTIIPPAPPVPAPVAPIIPKEQPVPLQPRVAAQASTARLTTTPIPPQESKGIIHEQSSFKKVLLSILILLFIAGASVGAYYYAVQKGFIGGGSLLTDDTIFKTTFDKIREIESSHYGVEVEIAVNPKEANAKSYEESYPLSDEEKAQYKRDQDRVRDIVKIKNELNAGRFVNRGEAKPFPAVLPATAIATDPQGNPYIYTPDVTGGGYTLSVTFETQDAVTAIGKRLYSYGESSENKISGKTILFTNNDYLSEGVFKGKPTSPTLFGYLDLSQVEKYIPQDFKASIHVKGTADKSTEKPLNAEFGLGADVYFGDAMFAFDFESIKKGPDYYGIVNKMPSFFSSYSKFKGTWFHITEDDIRNYGYGEYMSTVLPTEEDGAAKEKLKKAGEQFEILLSAADTHKIATIIGKPEKVKSDNGESLTKYTLQIASDNILPFYDDVTAQLAAYEDPLMEKEDTTIEFLKSDDAKKMLDFVKQNVTITLYYNAKGFPVKFEVNFRYVPSPEAVNLKDKQVNLIVTFWLDGINKPVEVVTPEESTPIDELLVELFGMTKEDLILYRQSKNVTAIQNALESYREWTGVYPQSLDQLTSKRKDTTQINADSTSAGSYGMESLKDRPFLSPVPSDIFAKAEFGYSATDSTYELSYTMQLPDFRSSKRHSELYAYANSTSRGGYSMYYSNTGTKDTRVLTLRYANGVNTATESSLSQANTDTRDTDGDRLSDALETYIGTNTAKTDSDSDGISDGEELKSGSDPSGPGRLESSNTSSLMF